MKRIFTFLTLIVAALVVSPQLSHAQQYAWVPVVSTEPIGTATENTGEADDDTYATYIGDLEDFSGENNVDSCNSKGGKGGKGGCDCLSCQRKSLKGSTALSRSYFGIEYLHWWQQGRALPPLVTTGDAASTTFSAAGRLPGATVAFGGGAVGEDLKAGARLTGGLWLDDCQTSAMFVRAFGTEGDTTPYSATSTGNPILAVPFLDQSSGGGGAEAALVVAFAGANPGMVPNPVNAQGSVTARASNDVWGGDFIYRTLLDEGADYRLDLLGGYQVSRIDDDLELRTAFTRFNLPGDPEFTTSDLFDVANEFHGGTIGVMGEFDNGPMVIQVMGKIGVGNMRQSVGISGSNTVTVPPGAPVTDDGGIFAQSQAAAGGPTFNIGNYRRDVLAWSPEVSVKGIYCVSDRVSVSVGYTFLYWTRVATAGGNIDRNVNRDVMFGNNFVLGGGSTPAFTFRDTDFWVQTIDLGLMFDY